MTENEWLGDNELSLKIWNNKYRNGNESFEEWLERVSNGNADIKEMILKKRFIFGGRILANRGVKHKVTYSNCYVIEPPEDNLESIFDCASRLARTFSYGGGCGIDISKLRPRGAKTNNAAKESSGAVSFMDVFSTVTGTIAQNGRRGALMISMDVNHPDIEEFIDCKTDLNRVNYANISVRMNDKFMSAVEHDKDYILRWPCDAPTPPDECIQKIPYNTLFKDSLSYYKKVKARNLFNKLAKNNWNYAEPGILYWDHISRYNIVGNDPSFKYAGTNPCAEEPLPAGGSCLLASLNLGEYVVDGKIDYDLLESDTARAIAALNQVLMEGMDLHPLEEQRKSVYDWRQIGLGTMGLADMFIKLGETYGSDNSLHIIEDVYFVIAETAIETSLQMAKDYGCYPKCNKKLLVQSPFIKSLNLPTMVLVELEKYGLFNSQLLTCAPTGSIGTMLQCSTGVEPIFAMKYTRTTKSLEGHDVKFDVYTKIAKDWLDANPDKKLPKYFVESKDIKPVNRVKVQACIQNWIDASISSTTNLPNEATVEDVEKIYMEAWKQGCKGITVYRAGCAREGILVAPSSTSSSEEKEPVKTQKNGVILDSIIPITRTDLGDMLSGDTYRNKTACGTLYTTINKDENGNIVEIFTSSSKNGTCKANLNGETRLASLALRAGVEVEEVIDSLKNIQCQSCAYARAKGNQIDGTSCPDIISKCLKRSYEKLHKTTKIDKEEQPSTTVIQQPVMSGEKCPECGHQLDHTGGCKTCSNCGYSKCE